ncbi:MAG: hypothetical protein AB1847_17570 [bacterium]
MLLWDRYAAVSFGKRGEEGIKVTGLRIAFEIEKTSEPNPNTARICIYNLHPKHWPLLESKDNLTVTLEVGYGGNLEQIYFGDIKKSSFSNEDATKNNAAPVTFSTQGPDTVTTIEAASGIEAIQKATIDKSYTQGIDMKTPLVDVVNTFKEMGGVIVDGALDFIKTGTFNSKKIQTGLALAGSSSVNMDNLTGALGLEWSIQDKKLQIIPKDGKTTEDAVLLSPKTGLVGSPVRREEGIEFTALIQPKIQPGRAVRIESMFINGDFRINKVRFNGDTHDNPWYCTAEAK